MRFQYEMSLDSLITWSGNQYGRSDALKNFTSSYHASNI